MRRKLLHFIGGPPEAPVFNRYALICSAVGAVLGAWLGDRAWLRQHSKETTRGT